MITKHTTLWSLLAAALLALSNPAYGNDAWFTRTVTVGPNEDVGFGYGTYEGAYILTTIIKPKPGYTIASSTCTDNAGSNLWHRTAATGNAHTWATYGVLPNFVVVGNDDESHAAKVCGTLTRIAGGGGGGYTSETPFAVKVCDIDIDVDALARHDDTHWTPADPEIAPALASEEDMIEDGGTNPNGVGGLRLPVTLPEVQPGGFPATLPESKDGWKVLRLRVNPKKAGYVYFTSSANTIAVYREILADPADTRQHLMGLQDGIRFAVDEYRKEIFHIHTSATFTSGHIEARFVPDYDQTSSLPAAKDDVRISLAGTAPDLILRDYDFYWNRAYQDFEKKDWATGTSHYNRVHNMADYGDNTFFNMDLNPRQADATITWKVYDNDDDGELEDSGTFTSGWRQFYTYNTWWAGDDDSLTFKLEDSSGNELVARNARAYSKSRGQDCLGECTALYMYGDWRGLQFASEALKTFTEGVNSFSLSQNPCTTGTYQLAVSDRLWTHNCGATPGLTAPTYTIPAYYHGFSSYISRAMADYGFRQLGAPSYAITDHGLFRDWLLSIILDKKQFIAAQFNGKPNGTTIHFGPGNGGPWRGVKDRWECLRFMRDSFAQPKTGPTVMETDVKVGVGEACGTIDIDFDVWKDNSGRLRVTQVWYVGAIWDLYDFDVYADWPATVAATLQFAHGRKLDSQGNTVGNGKIYYNEMAMWSVFNWNDGGSMCQIDWIIE